MLVITSSRVYSIQGSLLLHMYRSPKLSLSPPTFLLQVGKYQQIILLNNQALHGIKVSARLVILHSTRWK